MLTIGGSEGASAEVPVAGAELPALGALLPHPVNASTPVINVTISHRPYVEDISAL
jgi:hypothetical protein